MFFDSSDVRLLAAIEQLMQRFQLNRPNAETVARTVLEAADAAAALEGEMPSIAWH